jgi:hypothetical protein
MALLSFADSAPRAYRLKVGNAYFTFSTSTGTSPEILQRNTAMGKSMNPKMSGFRKWAEIHEPTKIDKARTGANEGGVIAAADVDQDRKTPDATTARPWLVSGASRG